MTLKTKEINIVICQADLKHCRYSEASLLPFSDGRLLLAYTDFYESKWEDDGSARIMGKWSLNEGKDWCKEFILQENIGFLNVMAASLLRLASGRIILSFMRKDKETSGNKQGNLHVMLKFSDDECKTWSKPCDITQGDFYWCSANDRLLQLNSGRVLMPVDEKKTGTHVWISDDDGVNWRKGKSSIGVTHGGAEPVVVELANEIVAIFLRNDLGNIHIYFSDDKGDTWKLNSDMGPSSGETPCMVRCIPNKNDLLLIWNNNRVRSNLTTAISRDYTKTWENYRILEAQEDWPITRSHTYPSLNFLKGNAHITYWETHIHTEAKTRLFHLVYRRLPISWFYEQSVTRRPSVYKVDKSKISAGTIYDGEEKK